MGLMRNRGKKTGNSPCKKSISYRIFSKRLHQTCIGVAFVIEQLERKLGGIRENLEMTDVSTPATVIRYTGNWKGSFEGWLMTKETGFTSLPKTLPGLKDFYMAGHWVEPGGGVPAALLSGRNLAQVIARK